MLKKTIFCLSLVGFLLSCSSGKTSKRDIASSDEYAQECELDHQNTITVDYITSKAKINLKAKHRSRVYREFSEEYASEKNLNGKPGEFQLDDVKKVSSGHARATINDINNFAVQALTLGLFRGQNLEKTRYVYAAEVYFTPCK